MPRMPRRFPRSRDVPRCGADLAPLMAVAARAWRCRQAARQALSAGDLDSALRLAEEAQSLQHTPAGRALSAVSKAVSAWNEWGQPGTTALSWRIVTKG